jgi:effector-binding domain-containing protein
MKRILILVLVGGVGALLYYFGFRRHEYEVNFKAATLPGDLMQTIRFWNRSLPGARILEVDSFATLIQQITSAERTYQYAWHFELSNDSITKVKVRISEPGNEFVNKLLIPFTEQPLESDAKAFMYQFHAILKEHLEITNVKVIGETQLDSSFCVCRTLDTQQTEKAQGMMKEYASLVDYVNRHNLQSAGSPIVRVREWSHEKNKLKYDFCFPVEPVVALPASGLFEYKIFPRERVLHAEYFGNYITSDRAWYELLKYADDEGLRVRKFPIEYFRNNPTLGIEEKKWKADIYLPVE